MTFYGQHFLYLSDSGGHPAEIINGARTARGLLTSMPTLFSGILANGAAGAASTVTARVLGIAVAGLFFPDRATVKAVETAKPAGRQRVTVTLAEFSVTPSSITVSPGSAAWSSAPSVARTDSAGIRRRA